MLMVHIPVRMALIQINNRLIWMLYIGYIA